ncbi:MAG TPA: NAD(P)H nitroreductase [Firmicutes bacterium]|jgi:nitroreductase|nr:NAD(P)H nitroreductase [Bacillota bacterium]HOQ23402.1 nitroreductase family protein [Bacillota bacterium]HPT66820.1 nitroreductase family protein [Bacillota bacterium]
MYELLKNRRSIRVFQDRAVEQEKIDILLKSALLAPSSRRRRPWEFIAVTDKGLLQQLAQCREHSSEFLAGAPLGVVILADPEQCDVWIEDASIAAIIIQLAAESLGLGSCWIQVRERWHTKEQTAEDYIKNLLGIPERYRIECMIAVGYKGEEKLPYKEEELHLDKLHFNRF